MQLRKYDEITAHMMEYLDKHIKLTPEELEAQKNTNQKKQGSKGDPTKKQKLEVSEAKPDIMFGFFYLTFSSFHTLTDGILYPFSFPHLGKLL